MYKYEYLHLIETEPTDLRLFLFPVFKLKPELTKDFEYPEITTGYIKLPFMFEGLFLGIIGSIIPILLSLYGYIIAYDHFGGYLFSHMIELVTPVNLLPITALVLVFIGGVVGMLGSWHAVRKYLKI